MGRTGSTDEEKTMNIRASRFMKGDAAGSALVVMTRVLHGG
jgi:hypothetical protein